MRSPLTALAATALAAMAVAAVPLLTGCAADDGWPAPRPAPSAVGALGPGFLDGTGRIAPEATTTPRPGSWDRVHPPHGYRVVLLTSGHDRPTKTLVEAVRSWADAEGADLRTVAPASAAELVPGIDRAIRMHPDLVVSAGDALIDPLATVTPNHLSQQFLVVGAELAEPTANVTSVDWSGASFRGEGLGMSSTYDAASFTERRCAAAVRAGVAAVLHRVTGVVIWMDRAY